MLKPLKIPRGIAGIMVLGNSTVISIDEKYKHRPDKILNAVGMRSMGKEIVNNYLSNISPISCENEVEYTISDTLFNSYFVRG